VEKLFPTVLEVFTKVKDRLIENLDSLPSTGKLSNKID